MEFTFRVEYKMEKHNKAIDALLRRQDEPELFIAISQPHVLFFYAIRREIVETKSPSQLQQQILNGDIDSDWTVYERLILYRNKVHLSSTSSSIETILNVIHNETHEEVQKTLYRIRNEFYWEGMKSVITKFVTSCPIC